MNKAIVEVRTQSAKGKWPKQGPDTYVAVQVVPDGVEALKYLNKKVAAKRGIEIIYCGEGYSNRQATEQSSLRQALAKAHEIAEQINRKELEHAT